MIRVNRVNNLYTHTHTPGAQLRILQHFSHIKNLNDDGSVVVTDTLPCARLHYVPGLSHIMTDEIVSIFQSFVK